MFLNDVDEVYKKDINDFINEQLNCVRICSVVVIEKFNRNTFNLKYNKKF